MEIEGYKNWLKSNKIRVNYLAETIGYNYRHLTLVLNGKKPITKPIEKALEMFKEIHSLKK